jgi:hypothetical protein
LIDSFVLSDFLGLHTLFHKIRSEPFIHPQAQPIPKPKSNSKYNKMAYTFGDDSANRGRNRRRRDPYQSPTNAATSTAASSQYTFGDGGGSPELSGAAEFTDGHSLTYSASSSQAGESTDSSLADIEFLRLVEREQQYHISQKQTAQSFRRQDGSTGNGSSSSAGFNRENSIAADSLGYSDDGEYQNFQGMVAASGHGNAHRSKTGTTSSGQPSASNGHDGGARTSSNPKIIFAPAAHSNPTIKSRSRTTATPSHKKTPHHSHSPTMVSTDISNSGSTHTPPPRHVKRIGDDGNNNEVWYQKWWMCGFTDALNLNSHPTPSAAGDC